MAMRALRASRTCSGGFTVEDVEIRVAGRRGIQGVGGFVSVPSLRRDDCHVHSQYLRKVADLPVANRRTEISFAGTAVLLRRERLPTPSFCRTV